MVNNRFASIKFDAEGKDMHKAVTENCMDIEEAMVGDLRPSRSLSLAITALEEFHMWAGKAIRDDQISRQADTEKPEKGHEV